MARKNESYTIRLAVEGGKVVRAEFGQVGADGEKAFKRIESAGKGATKSVGDLAQFVTTRLVPAFAAVQLARSAYENIQTFEKLDAKIRGLSQSGQDYGEIQEYLKTKANELNIDIVTLTNSYGDLLALQKNGLLDRGQVNALVEGLSNVKAALGVDDNQIGQVLFGLSQALASGTVRAEEFNQVVQPIPVILGDMERAAGLSSGALRKMVNAGEVTSEFFGNTLIKALENYNGRAAELTDTSVGAAVRLNNSWIELSRSFGQGGVSDALAFGLNILTMVNETLVAAPELIRAYINDSDLLRESIYGLSRSFDSFNQSLVSTHKSLSDIASDMTRDLSIILAGQKQFEDVDRQIREAGEKNYSDVSFNSKNPLLGYVEFQKNMNGLMSDLSGQSQGKLSNLEFGGISFKAPPVPAEKPEEISGRAYDLREKAMKEAAKQADQQRKKIEGVIDALKFENEQIVRSEKDQKLFNELRAAGVEIDSEAGQKIKALVEDYSAVTAQQKEYEKQQKRLAEAERDRQQALNQLGATFSSAFEDAIVQGRELSDVLQGLAEDIARLLVRRTVTEPLVNSLFGDEGVLSGDGGFLSALGFANGGVMTPKGSVPLRSYARGGIASSPQLAVFGEGSHNEAYVPLPDGRTIPVTMNGGGVNVSVNVINNSGSSVDVQQSRNESGGVDLQVIVDEQQARNIGRSGSKTRRALDQYMKQRTIGR